MFGMSGDFDFRGVVLVRGDVRLTGGGQTVLVHGGLLVGNSITAIDAPPDDADPSEVTISGNADVFYSSEVLDAVYMLLNQRANYHPILYRER